MFGAVEGMFLGVHDTPKEKTVVPSKTRSSATTPPHENQRGQGLNGKLASPAFKQLKQHFSELPLLVAPKLKEELIVYLSASNGAISAVLMTERGTVQMPIYFVIRTLHGPELNYTPMEYLFNHWFLPLRGCGGRLQKWSVILGEHNITYRPWTSVKGQIIADFLVEKPNESPSDTPMVEVPQELWILFMDGSSCIDGSSAGLILIRLKKGT
ncbi:reverse transcriptase domain-containing protein [Tanacetum coccineum]|uniref:Reverse transcriptase domain-containing protein n=1 Tax=Tanacetum coccineum TaxID=301880 RepID=A0ABQ5HCL7_9ASTR